MRKAFVFLFLIAFLGVSAQEKSIYHHRNIAVGITDGSKDSLQSYIFNGGFFGNVGILDGFQISALTSTVHQVSNGFNVASLISLAGHRMNGLQMAGIANGVGEEVRGAQFCALANVCRGSVNGIQLAGMVNVDAADIRGVQLGGVANISRFLHGVQISGFSNITGERFSGFQLCGIANIAVRVNKGVQMAAVMNVCASRTRGWQLAAYNYADTLEGSQFGIINLCVHHQHGVQVGLINYSSDTIAHKIGLVNVNPNTRIQMMVYGGTATKINLAARFRNRSTYNIIGFGTHYMGLDKRFSGAIFYRIGQYFHLDSKWSLSGDVGYYHIETFAENSSSAPERLYSLQARVNSDFQLARHLGIIASVGYGNTRYYDHARLYKSKMLLELGVTLF
jgi:hypothetical protein